MRLRIMIAVVMGLPIQGGCIIDTVPTPDDNPSGENSPPPVGDVDNLPIDTSGPGFNGAGLFSSAAGGGALLVVGTEGTVPGAGVVFIDNAVKSVRTQRPSTRNGSFALAIAAAEGDELLLRFVQDNVVQALRRFTVAAGTVDAIKASLVIAAAAGPPSSPDNPVIGVFATIPDEFGLVTVVGREGPIPRGITVVVVNPAGGATSADVTPAGSFLARLGAASGESLYLFAVEPAGSPGGGPTTTIRVP